MPPVDCTAAIATKGFDVDVVTCTTGVGVAGVTDVVACATGVSFTRVTGPGKDSGRDLDGDFMLPLT